MFNIRQWKCPYYKAFEDKKAIQCVCARINFLDRETWTFFADHYCDNVDGFEKCSIYKSLADEYERNERENRPQTKYQNV